MPYSATTPSQRLAELRRELATKIREYPDWVREKRLTQATADQRIAATRDALADLENLYAFAQSQLFNEPTTSSAKPAEFAPHSQ